MASERGAWCGSNVTEEQVKTFRFGKFLGTPEEVGTRVPAKDEISPAPRPGERDLFVSHLECRLALPCSAFLWEFLSFYGLQLHHLGANNIVQLSYFVALCEGYLGVWPHLGLFCRLFFLKAQTKRSGGPLLDCGTATITARQQTGLPKPRLIDSVKLWQQTYFYVRSLKAGYQIGLPEYSSAAPTKLNWDAKKSGPQQDVEEMLRRMGTLSDSGLMACDLTLCQISRRVMLLQARAHKICHMSGRYDPTRLSKKDCWLDNLNGWLRLITEESVEEGWSFGQAPYSRGNPAPRLFAVQEVEDGPTGPTFESDLPRTKKRAGGSGKPAVDEEAEEEETEFSENDDASEPADEESEAAAPSPFRGKRPAGSPYRLGGADPAAKRRRLEATRPPVPRRTRKRAAPPSIEGTALETTEAGVLGGDEAGPEDLPDAGASKASSDAGAGTVAISEAEDDVAGLASDTIVPLASGVEETPIPPQPASAEGGGDGATETSAKAEAAVAGRLAGPIVGAATEEPASGGTGGTPSSVVSTGRQALAPLATSGATSRQETIRAPPQLLTLVRGVERKLEAGFADCRLLRGSVERLSQAAEERSRLLERQLESYKNLLVEKLDEKNAEHERDTTDLRLRATKSDSFERDVRRLEAKVKCLEGSNTRHQEQFDSLVQAKKDVEARLAETAKNANEALARQKEAFDLLDTLSRERQAKDAGEISHLKVLADEATRQAEDAESRHQEREAELLGQLKSIDRAILAYYPEVDEEARKDAVDRAMAGSAPTTEDWVAQLGEEARLLRATAETVFVKLWPEDDPPCNISGLANRLHEAPTRIDELRESAAFGGAEMTLALMLSWYKDASVGKISAGFRVGTSFETLHQAQGVQLAARRIASFVDLDEVMPGEPDEEELAAIDGQGEGASTS